MLTGSASGLRSLLASSSLILLTCRPLWSPHFLTAPALLPHSKISTVSHHYTMPERRDGQASYGRPTTSNCNSSSARLLSPNAGVSANGTPSWGQPSVFSGMPTLSVYKDANSLPNERDQQQHGRAVRDRQCHEPHDRTRRKCPAQRRRTLLWLMLTTKSPDRAWAAYQELLSHRIAIPHHLLHQLMRLLASVKPRTGTLYLQLLSVLKTLQKNGGRIRPWEWNTLIDSTGKQWHKTRLEDYENSLDIFNKKGVLPTGSVVPVDGALDLEADPCVTQQEPDIWTYNILLSIASRSNSPLTIRHASSLLLTSGLPPNRYTHLCLLRYFAARNDLRSVRSTLSKMKQQDLEVGLDGINACLWAYARNGRFDVALRIYQILRSNIKPTPNLGEHDIEEASCYIRDTVGLDIQDAPEPDEITYTMMIQSLAYHGDLRNALGVFVDMLSAPNREVAARTSGTNKDPVCYKPSMAAFRGLFLGFARHGRVSEHHTVGAESIAALLPSSRAAWDLDTLETVFAAFLRLPSLPKPTGRVVYWIVVAFDKTSGNDIAKLREVWINLETKYGTGGWGGRLEEARKSIFASGDQNT